VDKIVPPFDTTLDCSRVFVQVYGKGAGLAIWETDGYRFVAARRDLLPLETARYRNIEDIELATGEIISRTSTV
jgi:hypothetical protein